MANWALHTDTTTSSTDNNYYEVGYWTNPTLSSNYISNTEASTTGGIFIPATFTNNGNQKYAIIYLYRSGTGNFTIELQENIGGVWTTRTTDTINIVTIYDITSKFVEIPLTSYAVDTTANKWRYKLSTSANNSLVYGKPNSTYIFGIVLDNVGCAVSGDRIFLLSGKTLTVDTDFNFGTDNTYKGNIVALHDSKVFIPNDTAKTINFYGTNLYGARFYFEVGENNNPIKVANKVILDFKYTSNVGSFVSWVTYLGANMGMVLKVYGDYGQPLQFIPNGASAGQNKVVTKDDMSSIWSTGDTVTLYGKYRNSATFFDQIQYTISAINGNEITLSSNIDYAVAKGGAIANLSENDQYGIETRGYNAFYITGSRVDYIKINGLYRYRNQSQITNPSYDTNNFNEYKNVLSEGGGLHFLGLNSSSNNAQIENVVYYYVGGNQYGGGFVFSGNNATVKNLVLKNSGAIPMNFGGSNCNIENICISGSVNAGVSISGGGNTLKNITITQGNTVAFASYLIASKIENLVMQGYASQYFLSLTNNVNTNFYNAEIGNAYDGTQLGNIFSVSNTFNSVIFYNSLVNKPEVYNIANAVIGTSIKYHKYNQEADDHRGFEVYGNYQSEASVRHTASGLSRLIIPTSSTNTQDYVFNVPTGNIQNKTMTVTMWLKINNSAYWAGTHQKPRLNITYDESTTVYAEATETTNWQLLSVAFTPTTTFGEITVNVNGRTDATGNNRYFYIDDFSVLYPAGYKLDLGNIDLWANANPITPPIATVLSASDVWTASKTIDYGSNTMGETLKNTELLSDDAVAIGLSK